jgi:cyclic pyranopterin monophosphate synthase
MSEDKMPVKFTHVDESGKAEMVNVSQKPDQLRSATACGFIHLSKETVKMIKENSMKKGDVLTVSQIAGIMGGKKTSELIPLCHPLLISKIKVSLTLEKTGVRAESFAECTGKTGIEMEALTAVSVALLTVYDMCKAVDKKMKISDIELIGKTKI